jgi:hypothetical protein
VASGRGSEKGINMISARKAFSLIAVSAALSSAAQSDSLAVDTIHIFKTKNQPEGLIEGRLNFNGAYLRLNKDLSHQGVQDIRLGVLNAGNSFNTASLMVFPAADKNPEWHQANGFNKPFPVLGAALSFGTEDIQMIPAVGYSPGHDFVFGVNVEAMVNRHGQFPVHVSANSFLSSRMAGLASGMSSVPQYGLQLDRHLGDSLVHNHLTLELQSHVSAKDEVVDAAGRATIPLQRNIRAEIRRERDIGSLDLMGVDRPVSFAFGLYGQRRLDLAEYRGNYRKPATGENSFGATLGLFGGIGGDARKSTAGRLGVVVDYNLTEKQVGVGLVLRRDIPACKKRAQF